MVEKFKLQEKRLLKLRVNYPVHGGRPVAVLIKMLSPDDENELVIFTQNLSEFGLTLKEMTYQETYNITSHFFS